MKIHGTAGCGVEKLRDEDIIITMVIGLSLHACIIWSSGLFGEAELATLADRNWGNLLTTPTPRHAYASRETGSLFQYFCGIGQKRDQN